VTSAGTAHATRECPLIYPFDPANFTDPTTITNTYLPRTVGSEIVLRKDDGSLIKTRVTQKSKIIKFGPDQGDWVNTRVIWELDLEEDGVTVVEEELRFEAQDDTMTGWNLGELIREPLGDGSETFENTWIAGFEDSLAGHTMLGDPTDRMVHQNKWYRQAQAPEIINDCARVWKTAVPVETQVVECGALLIRESSTSFDHEGGNQFSIYSCFGIFYSAYKVNRKKNKKQHAERGVG
jgi:hypothetical protein